jgi:hypothetical protein
MDAKKTKENLNDDRATATSTINTINNNNNKTLATTIIA